MRGTGPVVLAAGAAALALAVMGGAAAARSADPALTPEQERFFETSVRPVLAERCGACHGALQQRGGLRLDSRAALLRGGEHGPALVRGAPERSRLLLGVRHSPGAAAMPPGRKLAPREIAALARWVEMGAPWPAAVPATQSAGAGHWSFRPPQRAAAPRVRDRAWARTPIDSFILAGLEAKGLRPAPEADLRTLIRRATFDLTGLPPTPEEVEAFARDRSPAAYERLVERLLASPAYGEKWGRHWLDMARYADSNGLDENVHYGNAWRYRDWVIRAFNEDRPYDRFLVEQVAGDLMPDPDDLAVKRDRLVATGFLAVGPKFISEVDTEKVLMDLVDEQVDTLGRTVMGLTLGCARCHDHKFDPITTQDYYALAGIFKSTKTLEILKKPRMWWEHSLADPEDQERFAAHEKAVKANKDAVAAVTKEATAKWRAANPGMAAPKTVETSFPAEVRDELKRLREEGIRLDKDAPALPAAMGLTEGQVTDLKVHVRGDHLNLGEVVPRRTPVVLAAAAGQPPLDRRQSGRLQLAEWLVAPQHPLTARVMVNRVWRWHFGHGLVRSVDNFGLLGERPSHPELLDHLALGFVTGDYRLPPAAGPAASAAPGAPWALGPRWSIKSLHRVLMLSSTYRMGSAPHPYGLTDPENRLRWHFEPRRLQAEELRDALLAVSGLLDRTMGGKSLPLKNREYVFDHTSKDATRYDSRRRAVYLPVIRNNLYDVFQLFDFGDAAVPTGDRPTTTVAPQALFALNSDLVMDAAEALAARAGCPLGEVSADDGARLHRAYALAFGRAPTPKEVARDRALLARFAAESARQGGDAEARTRRAWGWLCHVLLAANEFVYVD